MFEILSTGQYYVEQIFYEAKKKGLKCQRANFWNLIRNPLYCGKIFIPAFKDEPYHLVKGKHAPIISELLFHDVQDFLEGRKRTYRTSVGSQNELVLRGHLICPQCGKLLTGSASRGRSARYYYYHCNSKCGVRFKSENVNSIFCKELEKFTPRAGTAETYTRIINIAYKERSKEQRDDVKHYHQKISELNDDIAKARRKFLTDKVDEKDFREFKQECEKEIQRIETELIKITNQTPQIDRLLNQAIQNLLKLWELYENEDIRVSEKLSVRYILKNWFLTD